MPGTHVNAQNKDSISLLEAYQIHQKYMVYKENQIDKNQQVKHLFQKEEMYKM